MTTPATTLVPFNRPYLTGRELDCIAQALADGYLAGGGPCTSRCEDWLRQRTAAQGTFLTHSCTAALEMAALLLEIRPGDEVILPSYTFVSTANAFVLRGATPVFVDIRPDTFNLDEALVEAAVTPRTRAIVPVHYAGVACEMDALMDTARRLGLAVVEDAAQALMATYRGRPLGGMGNLAALSFHATKNIIAGEGGALLVNAPDLLRRAEIIRDKGTDRSQFLRGEVDKYTWQDLGSSFLPGEATAAFLWAQLQQAEAITAARHRLWSRYHAALLPLEESGLLRRPVIPTHCGHNAHLYPVLLPDGVDRQHVLAQLRLRGVECTSHYVPLHNSPAGRRYRRATGALPVTDRVARSLIRLPLWPGLDEGQDRVVQALDQVLRRPP